MNIILSIISNFNRYFRAQIGENKINQTVHNQHDCETQNRDISAVNIALN